MRAPPRWAAGYWLAAKPSSPRQHGGAGASSAVPCRAGSPRRPTWIARSKRYDGWPPPCEVAWQWPWGARQVGREIIAGAGTGVDLLALRSRRTSPCIGEMDVQNLLSKVTDNLTVGRAFGEPIKSGDILIVPVVRIRGCGGGSCGTGATTEESGSAGGGGFDAKPAGVFVVKHGSVAWQPALDVM